MGRKVLPPAAAMQIKALYAEVDEHGRHRYTLASLADMFAVGETTIYRVIHGNAGYRALPEPKSSTEAEESLRRLQAANPEMFGFASAKMEEALAERREIKDGANKMLEEIAEAPAEIPPEIKERVNSLGFVPRKPTGGTT